MPIVSENSMKAPVAKFLRDAGYATRYERHVGARKIDVLGARGKPCELIAVELKVSKWLQALHQASFYAYWSNRAYVALPSERAKPAIDSQDLFAASGVGLLVVEKGRCSCVIEAPRRVVSRRDSYRQMALAEMEAVK